MWHALLRFSVIIGAIAASVSPDIPTTAIHLLHARLLCLRSEVEVSHVDIDLFDDEASHPAHAIGDVLAHRIRDLWNIDPIFDDHIQIYGGLTLPNLDVDPSRPLIGARDTARKSGNRRASAHRDKIIHPVNLTRGCSDDLRDNGIGDNRFPILGLQLNCLTRLFAGDL